MAGIVLERASRVFPDGTRALDGVDLEVFDGELMVILGPSGCGKTTALRIIAGLDRPTAGAVRFDGATADRLPPGRRGVAMAFQDAALYPHMTLRAALREAAGGNADGFASLGSGLLLDSLLDRLPHELSGGERQRAALARAMLKPCRVALFDEPLGGLDGPLRWHVRREIRRWQRETKTTLIYVTHDQEEALAVGDRIALLKGGKVEQLSTPAELYRQPQTVFAASFVGQPPMNLFPGARTSAGRWRSESWRLELPFPAGNGEQASAGIRPECLRFGPHAGEADAEMDGLVAGQEYLGDSTIVNLKPLPDQADAKNQTAAAWIKVPSSTLVPAVGARVAAGFRFCDVQWFDGKSGRALGASGAS